MSDLWTTIGSAAEQERYLRHLTAARTAAATSMAFVLGSSDPDEYSHREALMSERIDDAVRNAVGDDGSSFLDVRMALLSELHQDFTRVHEARQAEARRIQALAAARQLEERRAAERVAAAQAINAEFAQVVATAQEPQRATRKVAFAEGSPLSRMDVAFTEAGFSYSGTSMFGKQTWRGPAGVTITLESWDEYAMHAIFGFSSADARFSDGGSVNFDSSDTQKQINQLVGRLKAMVTRLSRSAKTAFSTWSEDDDEFDDGPDDEPCPVCGGPGLELGALGYTMHYRCQNCGWEWGVTADVEGRYPQADDLTFESAKTAAQGRFRIQENTGTSSGKPWYTLQYMGGEDSPGYGVWEDVTSSADRAELEAFQASPPEWWGTTASKTAAKDDDEGDDSCPECHADWNKPHDEECDRGRKQKTPGWIVDKKESAWVRTRQPISVEGSVRDVTSWSTTDGARDLAVVAVNGGFTWAEYAPGQATPSRTGRAATLEAAQTAAWG